MKISIVSMPVHDPIKAHEIYTNKLGFKSKEFDAATQLAIVTSADEPEGTALLLEPCLGSFAENCQISAYEANLPIIIFSVNDVASELKRLSNNGIKLRPDLDRPDWGLENMFEDGCGNIVMIENSYK